jgi:hypothetical protein
VLLAPGCAGCAPVVLSRWPPRRGLPAGPGGAPAGGRPREPGGPRGGEARRSAATAEPASRRGHAPTVGSPARATPATTSRDAGAGCCAPALPLAPGSGRPPRGVARSAPDARSTGLGAHRGHGCWRVSCASPPPRAAPAPGGRRSVGAHQAGRRSWRRARLLARLPAGAGRGRWRATASGRGA